MLHFDSKAAREQSHRVAQELGLPINDWLPQLELSPLSRTESQVVDRMLAMAVIAMVDGGMPKQMAADWFQRNVKQHFLTPDERDILFGDAVDDNESHYHPEAIFALCWAVGMVEDLDFSRTFDHSVISLFPRVSENESSDALRARAQFRPVAEITAMLDLAYCVHWAFVQCRVKKQPFSEKVPPSVVYERRLALEWLFSDADWDDVFMDT
jgi:hypothetical protein